MATNGWLSHVQDSHAAVPGSQFSHNYIRTEDLLKQKIVEGQVGFHQALWRDLLDGVFSYSFQSREITRKDQRNSSSPNSSFTTTRNVLPLPRPLQVDGSPLKTTYSEALTQTES